MRAAIFAVAVTAFVGSASAADASPSAKKIVYSDPMSYAGVRTAPKTKAAAKVPHVVLSTTGQFPDALVDEAGTVHIVWNEGRGDDADAAMYCRLRRAAKTCDTLKTLLWNKEYGAGDGPEFNIDWGGPRIVRVGDQLVVLSRRYPTAPSSVVAWTSLDGGDSWSTPEQVGSIDLGQLVVTGSADDPIILNLAIDTASCRYVEGASAACVQAIKSGEYSDKAEPLGTGSENYYPSLTLDDGHPLASFADLTNHVALRRWTGVGSPLDASTWTPSTRIEGVEEPQVAGGPGGTWLLDHHPLTGAERVRRLTRSGASISAGQPVAIGEAGDNSMGRITVDSGGGVHALWTRRDYGSSGSEGIYLRERSAGSFGALQKLTGGNGNGQTALAAAFDGGGFALFNHTGGLFDPGPITAIGFGPQGPTGKKGIGGVPGGGSVSCGQISFGQFVLKAAAGCFLFGTGANSRVAVTAGEVRINGLRIVPDAGAKIVIDPKDLQIDTTGFVRVMVSNDTVGDVVLFHGEIHRDIFRISPGRPLFEFPSQLFKAHVLGFDVAANIPVYLAGNGVRIPVDVELPPAFGGFTGHAELVANASGLKLDSLHIHIGPVPIGALVVDHVDLEYTGGGDRWEGDGKLSFAPAGGTLEATVAFEMGDFERATFAYTPPSPGIAIGPFVYLLRVGGGFEVKPAVKISANASVGAGASFQGEAPVKVDGEFTMTFPSNAPAKFHMGGTVNVFLFEIGNGNLDFQTNGYATFDGHTGLEVMFAGTGFDLNGNLEGFVDARNGKFGAKLDGSAQVCMWFVVPLCTEAGIETAVSDVGLALCGRFTIPISGAKKTGGLRFPWADFEPIYLQYPALMIPALIAHIRTPCNTDGYYLPPPSSPGSAPTRAGSTEVSVRSGLPSETILVEGNGGRPDATVTGPGGVSISSSGQSKGGYVAGMNGVAAEYFVLEKPQAGSYTVTPNAGSVPVKRVLLSDGYKPASVKAKLGGSVSTRTIRYRITNLGHGQSVTFAERGAFGTRLIKTVSKARGTLRFRPVDGKGGRRTVLAFVKQRGMVTDTSQIGRFTAPGPSKPAAVLNLKAKRSGTKLTVGWKRVKGAARYVVALKGSKGTKLGAMLPVKAKSARFKSIRRDERLTVSVRALSKSFLGGPVRKVVVRPS
jgi:hypothetical protein